MEVQHQKRTSDRVFQIIAGAVIAFVAVALLVTYTNRIVGKSHTTSAENNAYLRASACVISTKTPATRTAKDIANCYDLVEKDTGIHLKRYDHE